MEINEENIRLKFKPIIRFKKLNHYRSLGHNNDLIYWKNINNLHNQEGDKGTDNRIERVSQGTAHKTTQLWGTLFRFYNMLKFVKKSNLNVLDLGCDDAFVRKMIHSGTYVSGTNYVGVDIKLKYLQAASNRMPKCNTPAVFITDDLYNGLPYIKKDSIDILLCMEMLEHLELEAGHKLVKEMFRVLKPGGILYLSMPNHDPTYWYVWKKYRGKGYPWHLHEYTIKEFTELYKKVGYKLVYSFGNLANRKRLELLLSPAAKAYYDGLVKVMGPEIPVQVFGQLYPDACGGMVYVLTKE